MSPTGRAQVSKKATAREWDDGNVSAAADIELIKDVGDRVDLRFTFTIQDSNDVAQLAYPTLVTVTVRRPDGFEYDDTANVQRDSIGVYNWHGKMTMSETWYVRCVGTGNVEQMILGAIRVLHSPFVTP